MQLYYFFELTRDECLRDDRCGPMLRAYEANPDTAHIVGLMDPPDSMDPITTWDTLTRGDCLQIEACDKAFHHAYRRSDIFPEVILGSPHEMRTTAEVLADEQARAASYAAKQAEYEGWDGFLLMLTENVDIQKWLIVLAVIVAVAIIYYVFIRPGDIRREAGRKARWEQHGSAKWLELDKAEKNEIYGKNAKGILLGYYEEKPIRYPGKAHLLTFAPTGSGKGTTAIVPNLLEYPGSVVCIDPKGENAAITARRRRAMGQKVFLLDPFKVRTDEPACFNPLDWVLPQSENFNADCMMLADALIVSGPYGMDHWDRSARDLITDLLMFVAAHETPERRNFIRVYDFLSATPDQLAKLTKAMQNSSMATIARAGNRIEQMQTNSNREFASIMSSARGHMKFLDVPQIETVMSKTTFDPMKLKSGDMTMYLILEPDQLKNLRPWMRLMITMMIAGFARDKTVPDHQTLFLLDEFAALGTLDSIKTAMGLMRGYGVKLWPILQDLSQLQGLYPDMWASFIANAGVCQVFGTNDPNTANYFSEKAGVSTIAKHDVDGNIEGPTGRALMMPDEIMRMQQTAQLLFLQHMEPMHCAKRDYRFLPQYKGQWDKNPFYK